MKRYIIYFFLIAMAPVVAQAQDSRRMSILEEIEENNTTLRALRQQTATDKAQNRVGNALPDPTFGFSYSWGNHKGMDGKKTFSAEQELDLGTLTGRRARTARKNSDVIDWNYQIEKQLILAEAEQLLVQLTFQNAMCEELSMRLERAAELKRLYDKKMKAGDANQLEVNKIKLLHTATMAAYKKQQAERHLIVDHLQRLNGNQSIQFGYTQYETPVIPPLVELTQKAKVLAPQLQMANATLAREEEELKLNKVEGLPGLSIGYTGEHVGGNNYNGVSVGVSLPIWGNSRRKIRQQKSAVLSAEMKKEDVEAQMLTTLQLQYENALSLIQVAHEFTQQLHENQDLKLLRKALAAGQLSLIEYLNELAFYDEARTQAITAQRDSQLAVASLLSIFR